MLEIDHDIPIAIGGKGISTKYVYHRHCHDEKTVRDLELIAKHRAAGISHKRPYTEEPDAVKVACPVLDWRRGE